MEGFKVSDEAKTWLRSIAKPLKDFYLSMGRHMSEGELYLEIERRFGDEIMRKVCIPHGFNLGACLLIARAVAEEI